MIIALSVFFALLVGICEIFFYSKSKSVLFDFWFLLNFKKIWKKKIKQTHKKVPHLFFEFFSWVSNLLSKTFTSWVSPSSKFLNFGRWRLFISCKKSKKYRIVIFRVICSERGIIFKKLIIRTRKLVNYRYRKNAVVSYQFFWGENFKLVEEQAVAFMLFFRFQR